MNSPASSRWRLGIDVGGTFTDLVAVPAGGDDARGMIAHKVPSTPDDPSLAVAHGLRDLLARGIAPSQVEAVTHGTTIGLNAILQQRGARVAVLTSTGHRDLLAIGRARLPRSFDLHAVAPRAAVPREAVVEIDLRFDPSGAPVHELTDRAYALARDDLRSTGPQAVAVCLVGGYGAAETERRLAARLEADLGVPVTAAATVWPEAGEYERTTLAVLDAQIRPLMTGYLRSLRDRIGELGLNAPLFISTSNGGSVSLASAVERPIQTVLSGPASGVAAAAHLWPEHDVVTFDMGGTSSDIGILRRGRPALTTAAMIGEHPLTMPVVDVSAIGAGGGSVIWEDDAGETPVLRVGPRSVGAVPGPAAYGTGGGMPALTDAYVHAGFIAPETFLAGTMPLDPQAATTALRSIPDNRGEAAPDADTVADDALHVATAGMSARVRTVLARHGEVPDRFTFVAFGGAGGTHAALLAQDLGVRHVIVPAAAGTFCALGAAIAPIRRDLIQTLRLIVDDEGIEQISRAASTLTAEAVGWLHEQGTDASGTVLVSADLRYAGQPASITVDLVSFPTRTPPGAVPRLTTQQIIDPFTAEHSRRYGFSDPGGGLHIDALRVAVTGQHPPRTGERHRPALTVLGRRPLRIGGTRATVAVAELAAADGGHVDHETAPLPGPAVVERGDTSVFVPHGWQVEADSSANLHLRPVPEALGTGDGRFGDGRLGDGRLGGGPVINDQERTTDALGG